MKGLKTLIFSKEACVVAFEKWINDQIFYDGSKIKVLKVRTTRSGKVIVDVENARRANKPVKKEA